MGAKDGKGGERRAQANEAKDAREGVAVAGLRRCSWLLLEAQTEWAVESRRREAKTSVGQMLVLGFDVDEVLQLDRQIAAGDQLARWLRRMRKLKSSTGALR